MAAPTSYYFWKWADNDLSGKPADVHASLLRGKLHPALQAFDARPLLAELEKAAFEGRALGEEWDWKVNPASSPENAQFVFVMCPYFNASQERVLRFHDWFVPLDLAGWDEQSGHTIPCSLPKLSCFINGQLPFSEAAFDISPDDLPVLIRGIRPSEPEPWGELLSRRNGGVVCKAQGRRFCVEWRVTHDMKSPHIFEQWRAQDAKRFAALNGADPSQNLPVKTDPDFITYAETLKIFEAFLRGEPRPPQYQWRKLKMGKS